MGSSVAPKMFSSGSPFSQSQGDVVTQAQPQAQAPDQATPDLSAYTMQQATPGTSAGAPTSPMADGSMDNLQQWRANRSGGGGRMPFFGNMA